ncbi:MAG: hypothetical protein M1834_006151 [Cirrosporium novae-zelandiae]|nr:MAG: hypothetical protein M1834_006151 [Cirrosporium novae-zelandiae]
MKLHTVGSLTRKPANKERRQLQHIQRKRDKDVARRTERFRKKKEEAKDPNLRTDRLRRNIPLTLERKRVWDDADSDVEDGIGLSVDVERLKRQRTEEDEELNGEDIHDDEDGSEDDQDSMLDPESEDDEEETEDAQSTRLLSSNALPTATERATSPVQSTRSTNLNLTPEALANKYPSLFNNDAAIMPKVLVTTSINSTLHHQAKLLTTLIPNSVYIRRSAHRYGHKFSVREIAKFATNRQYTSLFVLEEDQKRPCGLTIVHLPSGPTFHFSVSNWVDGKRLPGHGNPTEHFPELILNGFRTPLGLLTAHLFKTIFPPKPEFQGRQVVTLHNQRDYIFLRRHRYIFRTKRPTEKSVVGADGEKIKGVEDIRAGLQELGPRFTLKLRRIDKGIQRMSGQEWEWKGGLEKERTKFQL